MKYYITQAGRDLLEEVREFTPEQMWGENPQGRRRRDDPRVTPKKPKLKPTERKPRKGSTGRGKGSGPLSAAFLAKGFKKRS